MAVDATARLYDVDEDSCLFKKLQKTEKYDQGTLTFRARKGKLIDLDKLHESIWATRLAHGTRSGLVTLEVVAIGEVVKAQDGTLLNVSNSDSQFELAKGSSKDGEAVFAELKDAATAGQVVKVTGVIDGYKGRWPALFKKKLPRTRRILVTGFDNEE